MADRVVLAYFGDEQSKASIARMREIHRGGVIALALDIGEGSPLNALKDDALAAGALRCHALDVREEFIREALLPALRSSDVADAVPVATALVTSFVAAKLRLIAALEQAAIVAPGCTDFARFTKVSSVTSADPIHLEITFADGIPVAVNHVAMTLAELMESIEIISGAPAFDILGLAYRQLDGSDQGHVHFQSGEGRWSVRPAAAPLT